LRLVTHCAGGFLGVFVGVGWAGGAWGGSSVTAR